MNPKKLILITTFLLVACGYFIYNKNNNFPTPNEITYSGTISDNDTSCYHDGVCKVKVGNYWIITNLGGDPDPEMVAKLGPVGRILTADGTLIGDVGNYPIGKQVEVFAKIVDVNTLTLVGNKNYYIRFRN